MRPVPSLLWRQQLRHPSSGQRTLHGHSAHVATSCTMVVAPASAVEAEPPPHGHVLQMGEAASAAVSVQQLVVCVAVAAAVAVVARPGCCRGTLR
mmetsp:Transcript_3041/g.7099  ORF Transcript_3041/g.7099 Transcript_3041/m.7099 type:complete len:95 (-) Transcript_3041:953-1237(-)